MALSANQWLALFPSISNEMRLGIIVNPPSNLDPEDLFRAIIALEKSSRNALLQQIPKETLKKLIRSMPRDKQISFYSALGGSGVVGGSHSNIDTVATVHSKTSRRNANVNQWISSSNYEGDPDVIADQCSKHINCRQFAKEYYLFRVCMMMRSFGDSPLPSRYSALIILNHLKAYLCCLLHTVQTYHLGMDMYRRGRTKYFDLIEKWFPAHIAMFNRSKGFKSEDEKNSKEEDSDDHSDDGIDEEGDIGPAPSSSVYIAAIDRKVGWELRKEEWVLFEKKMAPEQYFKFVSFRNASFFNFKKSAVPFCQWLQITNETVFGKLFLPFLSMLAMDRVACIVQIARKLEDYNFGTIIDDMDEFLRPTVIVQAVLLLNQTKTVTPIEFEDASLVRVDVEHIDMSKYIKQEKEAEAEEKKDQAVQSNVTAENDYYDDELEHVQCSKRHGNGKKRMLASENECWNPAKKQKQK